MEKPTWDEVRLGNEIRCSDTLSPVGLIKGRVLEIRHYLQGSRGMCTILLVGKAGGVLLEMYLDDPRYELVNIT